MTDKTSETLESACDASNRHIQQDATVFPARHRRHAWQLPSLVLAFSIAFLYGAYVSFTFEDPALASRCEMAWMSPGYLRMDGLTEQHSRLARKYALWLYREQGWDLSNKVRCLML